jgi:hypothetical protein
MTAADLQAAIAHMGATARAASAGLAASPVAARNGALTALAYVRWEVGDDRQRFTWPHRGGNRRFTSGDQRRDVGRT